MVGGERKQVNESGGLAVSQKGCWQTIAITLIRWDILLSPRLDTVVLGPLHTLTGRVVEDGTIEQNSLDMMRQLRRAIREK
jgi:hypothetical protein